MTYPELNDIESNYPRNASKCLQKTISKWLTNGGETCNWKFLVAAIRAHDKAAADVIEEVRVKIHNPFIIYFLLFQRLQTVLNKD